ncbi:hypothetical protein M5585_21905 [Serratia ureilytica]
MKLRLSLTRTKTSREPKLSIGFHSIDDFFVMSVIHFSLFFFYQRVGSMMQTSSAMGGNIFEWGVIDESNDDICACREQRAVAAGGLLALAMAALSRC